jgi:hypothetical protein
MTETVVNGQRATRIELAALDLFLGATAVLGGLGLLLHWYPPPPPELLAGSPFGSYTIPALVLAVVVGGSALVAAVAVLVRHPLAAAASAVAGLMILSFEAVQIAVIGLAWLQAVYVANGLLILALAARLWVRRRAMHRAPARPSAGRLAA